MTGRGSDELPCELRSHGAGREPRPYGECELRSHGAGREARPHGECELRSHGAGREARPHGECELRSHGAGREPRPHGECELRSHGAGREARPHGECELRSHGAGREPRPHGECELRSHGAGREARPHGECELRSHGAGREARPHGECELRSHGAGREPRPHGECELRSHGAGREPRPHGECELRSHGAGREARPHGECELRSHGAGREARPHGASHPLRSIGLWLLVLAGGCPAQVRVLFIGNSLTAANDLPGMVEAVAKANGERVATRMVAFPNYSLEDHWNRGDARRAIAEGGWTFVVLQQGPSSLAESRVLLVEYAKRFAGEAARVHARTALYMVWPAASRAGDFDGVKLSYETAAREVAGIFLPAGEAWRIAWRRDARLAFYGTDGFHPTRLGSLLAAVVIYEGLTGKTAARGAMVSYKEWSIVREAASGVSRSGQR